VERGHLSAEANLRGARGATESPIRDCRVTYFKGFLASGSIFKKIGLESFELASCRGCFSASLSPKPPMARKSRPIARNYEQRMIAAEAKEKAAVAAG